MDVFETLKEAIRQSVPDIDVEAVSPDSHLINDLGLDSLGIMMIAVIIEEEFGFDFEGDISFETVGKLCEYIENKIA